MPAVFRIQSSVAMLMALAVQLACAAQSGIRIESITQIHIDRQTPELEWAAARDLNAKLRRYYGTKAIFKTEPPAPEELAIVIGRAMVEKSGIAKIGSLEALKYDGYLIRCENNRIALAGYEPQGTVYAMYALLRLLGIEIYPWQDFGPLEVFKPLNDGILPPLAVNEVPYFHYRGLLGHLDQGRWGASFESGGLGDFRFAMQQHHPEYSWFNERGWLPGDHSAPYLVPMANYHEKHPEYYAEHGGKRLPKDTANARVALCLSNPEVARISAARAIEWMNQLPQRRFYYISDGDTDACRCTHCRALDPLPGHATDRYLQWANIVANAFAQTHPENKGFILGYGEYTRPPLRTGLAPNLIAHYCPWYWNSRTTSAVSWANPLNVKAMEEFVGWQLAFPEQLGLYDYPDGWASGTAQRLKFLARNGVRYYYACGGSGDRYQWINSRLLWNPFEDIERLEAEFCSAHFGPAAASMQDYYRSADELLNAQMKYSHRVALDARHAANLRTIISALKPHLEADSAATADQRLRIALGIGEIYRSLLTQGRPDHAHTPALVMENYYRDRQDFLDLWSALLKQTATIHGQNASWTKIVQKRFEQELSQIGLLPEAKKSDTGKTIQIRSEELFDRAVASLEDDRKLFDPASAIKSTECPPVSISFDSADELAQWTFDASQAALIPKLKLHSCARLTDESNRGVLLEAALSRLPVIPFPDGNADSPAIHAGRIYAERRFDPPLELAQNHFVEIRLIASTAAPLTVYLDRIHSDFMLLPGEQILRIDLRNYRGTRFEYEQWDKKLKRISFDLWPQDNAYPYTGCKDMSLLFLELKAQQGDPQPSALPYRNKVLWMTHFRANLPHRDIIPRSMSELLQRQHYRHVGGDKGNRWIRERFRTFTAYRQVSPIFEILIDETEGTRRAAELLQTCFQKSHGVTLPIKSWNMAEDLECANAILLGNYIAKHKGLISDNELNHLGTTGFILKARNSQITIAGSGKNGIAHGAVRYLNDLGLDFFVPGRLENVPALKDRMLYELYLLERPWFSNQMLPGIEDIGNADTPIAWDTLPAPDLESVRQLSEKIKAAARAGQRHLDDELLLQTRQSPLHFHIASLLLWDPFRDTMPVIRKFETCRTVQTP